MKVKCWVGTLRNQFFVEGTDKMDTVLETSCASELSNSLWHAVGLDSTVWPRSLGPLYSVNY